MSVFFIPDFLRHTESENVHNFVQEYELTLNYTCYRIIYSSYDHTGV